MKKNFTIKFSIFFLFIPIVAEAQETEILLSDLIAVYNYTQNILETPDNKYYFSYTHTYHKQWNYRAFLRMYNKEMGAQLQPYEGKYLAFVIDDRSKDLIPDIPPSYYRYLEYRKKIEKTETGENQRKQEDNYYQHLIDDINKKIENIKKRGDELISEENNHRRKMQKNANTKSVINAFIGGLSGQEYTYFTVPKGDLLTWEITYPGMPTYYDFTRKAWVSHTVPAYAKFAGKTFTKLPTSKVIANSNQILEIWYNELDRLENERMEFNLQNPPSTDLTGIYDEYETFGYGSLKEGLFGWYYHELKHRYQNWYAKTLQSYRKRLELNTGYDLNFLIKLNSYGHVLYEYLQRLLSFTEIKRNELIKDYNYVEGVLNQTSELLEDLGNSGSENTELYSQLKSILEYHRTNQHNKLYNVYYSLNREYFDHIKALWAALGMKNEPVELAIGFLEYSVPKTNFWWDKKFKELIGTYHLGRIYIDNSIFEDENYYDNYLKNVTVDNISVLVDDKYSADKLLQLNAVSGLKTVKLMIKENRGKLTKLNNVKGKAMFDIVVN